MADTCDELRQIPGFPGYWISSAGELFSDMVPAHQKHLPPQRRKLSPFIAPHGYAQTTLFRDGKRRLVLVHSLVLLTFVGPRPKGFQACHANGNRSDNRLSNLRWDSVRANHADKRTHGTMPIGEGHPRHKLTNEEVDEIRRLHAEGASRRAIARQFGVSDTWVYRLANRLNWTHR